MMPGSNTDRIAAEALEYAVNQSGEFMEDMASKGYTYDLSNWPRELYSAFIESVTTDFLDRWNAIHEAQNLDPPFFKPE